MNLPLVKPDCETFAEETPVTHSPVSSKGPDPRQPASPFLFQGGGLAAAAWWPEQGTGTSPRPQGQEQVNRQTTVPHLGHTPALGSPRGRSPAGSAHGHS